MSESQTPILPEVLETEHTVVRRKHRRRRSRGFRFLRRFRRRVLRYNWKMGVFMGVGFGAALVMVALILALSARDRIDNSWNGLSRVWNSVSAKPGTELTLADFERIQIAVNDMNGSIASVKRQTLFLRPFTFASADLEATIQAMDAAQELTLAADAILGGMEPTVFFLTEGEKEESVTTQLSSGERIVELLDLGRGRFITAQGYLDSAQNIIEGFDKASISPDLLMAVNGLGQYHDQLADINQMLQSSPGLLNEALGINEDRTYLVLASNSDELRPSGGYISTYGWITVRNGRIINYDYSPTTPTSPNPPPTTLASTVEIPDWWIQYRQPIYAAWDGSWYVDFPSTAQMAQWYYDEGGNPGSPVDGVIAIDLVGFEYLLGELGEVYLEGYNQTINVENFREETYLIRRESEGETPHKQFVAAVYRQILADWQSVDPELSVAMRGAALRALQEKHIMVYFSDQDLNHAASVFGWSGEQKPAVDHDYLMVAEANMGNKANRSVIRQWTYDVEIREDGTLHSRAAIAYDYSDRIASLDPAVDPANGDLDYSSLVQVFVPVNTTLLETTNLRFQPTVVDGDEHTSFIARIKVEYDQNERIIFSYDTPVLVEQFGPYRRYRLVLQKQPGTQDDLVNVQISLPAGATVIDTDPEPVASYALDQPILEFRLTLETDQEIEVLFRN